ncbi:MAG: hypothetical protein HGA85_03655 [Nanoarchaeota archaeon]|nr:hypothetical protein [Nanoarchaeota archaeon]
MPNFDEAAKDAKAATLAKWIVSTPYYQILGTGIAAAIESGKADLLLFIKEVTETDTAPGEGGQSTDPFSLAGTTSANFMFFLGAYGGRPIESCYSVLKSLPAGLDNELSDEISMIGGGIEYRKALPPFKAPDVTIEGYFAKAEKVPSVLESISGAAGLVALLAGKATEKEGVMHALDHVVFDNIRQELAYLVGSEINSEDEAVIAFFQEAREYYAKQGKDLSDDLAVEWQKDHKFHDWLFDSEYNEPWFDRFCELTEGADQMYANKSLAPIFDSVLKTASEKGFFAAIGKYVFTKEMAYSFHENLEDISQILGTSPTRPIYARIIKDIGEGAKVHIEQKDLAIYADNINRFPIGQSGQ